MPGDWVISGSGQRRIVRGIKVAIAREWRDITVQANGETETIRATPTHPFWALRAGSYRWVDGKDLACNDILGARRMSVLSQAVSVLRENNQQEEGEQVLQPRVLSCSPCSDMVRAEVQELRQGFQGQEDLCGSRRERRALLQPEMQGCCAQAESPARGDYVCLRDVREAIQCCAKQSVQRGSALVLQGMPEAQDYAQVLGMQNPVRDEAINGQALLLKSVRPQVRTRDESGGDDSGRTANPESSVCAGGQDRTVCGGLSSRQLSGYRSGRGILAFEPSEERRREGTSYQATWLEVLEDQDAAHQRYGEGGITAGPDHAVIPQADDTGIVTDIDKVETIGFCYDLEIEGDHSYLVGPGIIAHNTDCCRHLDGKQFYPTDPYLDRLTPPRHWNCRSILVPIKDADQIDSALLVTSADFARAQGECGQGFV